MVAMMECQRCAGSELKRPFPIDSFISGTRATHSLPDRTIRALRPSVTISASARGIWIPQHSLQTLTGETVTPSIKGLPHQKSVGGIIQARSREVSIGGAPLIGCTGEWCVEVFIAGRQSPSGRHGPAASKSTMDYPGMAWKSRVLCVTRTCPSTLAVAAISKSRPPAVTPTRRSAELNWPNSSAARYLRPGLNSFARKYIAGRCVP